MIFLMESSKLLCWRSFSVNKFSPEAVPLVLSVLVLGEAPLNIRLIITPLIIRLIIIHLLTLLIITIQSSGRLPPI